jgi:outer membrane autotransporter protein
MTALPVLADGGPGGRFGGGAGGTGFNGNPGGDGSPAGGGGGGGGAAGGGHGGNGGGVAGGIGGSGGTAVSPNGGAGGSSLNGGGGGGGGGFNGNGAGASTLTNSALLVGGNGGSGGDGSAAGPAGGGGGGAGGYGAVVTGGGASTNTGLIVGGQGGAGGNGTATGVFHQGGFGGGGGDGGVGALFAADGVTFTNSGIVAGGRGGAGGNGTGDILASAGGSGGAGGAGLVFTRSAATFSNSGIVTGGAGGTVGSFALANNFGLSGGAGGVGALFTGSGATFTNSGIVNGGAGGNGGPFDRRIGGDGGAGVQFAGSGATLNNSGIVAGGASGGGGFFFGATGGVGVLFTGSGGTLINSGTILGGAGSSVSGFRIGAGGAGISGTGLTIINGGFITGGLSGDGVTRANAITFTGGTNVLELQAGSVITGNVVAFSSADTLRLGGSNFASFDVSQIGPSAQYQGFGVFQKSGSSTWTLTGTTTAVTNWAINQGMLAISSDANLGNAGGTLSFNGGSLQFLSGLTSSRSITLNAGGGTFDTIGNTVTLSGAIGGSGGLTKIGSGTLVLPGSSTYTGATNVDAGILDVNGSLASTVFVNSGATLMGSGTVGGLSVASGGIMAPGNSIGTLTVGGNVSFAPGSLYLVEANAAGQSDRISASGRATLSGGTVQVLAQFGNFAPQTTYTILTAAGGLTGTFAAVSSNLAFLTASLSYDANDVFLTLTRNAFFVSQAANANQRSVAAALDTSPLTSALVLAVLNQTATGARQAFDALSGEIHASVQTSLIEDSLLLRETVLNRLRQASFAHAAGPMAALATGGPMLAYADAPALASAPAAFPVKAPPAAAGPDLTYWAQGIGAFGRLDSDGNAAEVRRNLAGFFTGFDRRFGDWRAGLAAGYTTSNVSESARLSSANIDSAHLAAYAGANYGPVNLRAGAAASFATLDTSRAIQFPGFFDQASAHYDAATGQVFGEVGYALTMGRVAVEPFAGAAYVHVRTDALAENGGVAALVGSGSRDDVGYSTLGVRAATTYVMPDGTVLTSRVSAAWQHAFGAVDPTAALAFASTGAGFVIASVPLARDAALVDAGADLQLTPRATLGVSYLGQLAAGAQDHAMKGTFTLKF